MSKLVEHLVRLQAVTVLLDYSKTEDRETSRFNLWSDVLNFYNKHKKYSEASWSLSAEKLNALEPVFLSLKPKDKFFLYQRLFNHNALDLYEDDINWEEQEHKLRIEREHAIYELISEYGYDKVIIFVQSVNMPEVVGRCLGLTFKIEESRLKIALNSEDEKIKQFISGYICSLNNRTNGTFIDDININKWDTDSRYKLLILLPFNIDTWKRVKTLLGSSEEILYWSNTIVAPYLCEKDDLYDGIDCLLKYNRPLSAISCLSYLIRTEKTVKIEVAVRALLDAVNTCEKVSQLSHYEISELIKFVQSSNNSSDEDLFKVEWAYLPLITSKTNTNTYPKNLEERLTKNADFFCEIIQLVYKSDKVATDFKPSDTQKNIARNARELLDSWRKVPGYKDDGSFDATVFDNWVSDALRMSKESGHLKPTLRIIGKILFYTPKSEGDLWINENIAHFLNRRELGCVRDSFKMEAYNSRGVYFVDPEGKPEIALSEEYHSKSESMELLGYQRFARTLREISERYSLEAKRLINKESHFSID
ncbi:hypothetical protein [Vibrio parahaemolyticus]|uniref:hypothetical protein n=1 Tax=Vibrio parahaemolyticus TaxID=670 RepID=UPI002ACDAA25|nr:hypothetical protein [Vibrio parahaemolyticus]